MTWHDDELRNELRDRLARGAVSIGPDGEVFKMLARLYPLADSRIDWRKLELRVQGGSGDEPDWTSRFVSFFREQRDVHGLSGRVIYAGDGVTTLAVQADMDDMIEIMPIVLSYPQHHYFVSERYRWCFCMSFENAIDFGLPAAVGFSS